MLRLLAPWALLALLATSLLAPGPFYRAAFAVQALCYVFALLGLWGPAGRFRPFAAAASFLVLNAAAWAACWVWVTGRTERTWVKAAYRGAAAGREAVVPVLRPLLPRAEPGTTNLISGG